MKTSISTIKNKLVKRFKHRSKKFSVRKDGNKYLVSAPFFRTKLTGFRTLEEVDQFIREEMNGKTHCANGHVYPPKKQGKKRVCGVCKKLADAAYREKNRERIKLYYQECKKRNKF